MKHKWEIKPRGKLTKYYVCKKCNMTVVASSKKLANELEPKCEGITWRNNINQYLSKKFNLHMFNPEKNKYAISEAKILKLQKDCIKKGKAKLFSIQRKQKEFLL